MRASTERKMKRWQEQRWILDQVIKVSGLDFDQGRSHKMLRNCGPGIAGELRGIGQRVQKFTDFPREFSRAAEKRERQGARGPRRWVTTSRRASTTTWRPPTTPRPSGASTRTKTPSAWPGRRASGDCYDRYIRFADHPIERVDLTVPGGKQAALLHFAAPAGARRAVPVHPLSARHGTG